MARGAHTALVDDALGNGGRLVEGKGTGALLAAAEGVEGDVGALGVAEQDDLAVGAGVGVAVEGGGQGLGAVGHGEAVVVKGGRVDDGLDGRVGDGGDNVVGEGAETAWAGVLGGAARHEQVDALGAADGGVLGGGRRGGGESHERRGGLHLDVGGEGARAWA